jgi:hypothetical protein
VNRDEHWQFIDRTSPLQLTAELKPLALRQSSLQLPDAAQPTSVEFPAAVQQSPLETIRFANHSSVQTISHGQGKILLSADPVEFAESNQPAARLYAYALKVAGVIPAFREIQPLSPGVLAFPTVLPHAILYSFSNESSTDQPINIADTLTGAMLRFNLQAQRGAVVLMDRSNGKILTSYGKRSPEPTE